MNISRAQDGFVKLHLKIADSDLWYDNNALVVFTRMLLMAHYKDDFASIRFAGKQYKLKAGEFSATIDELAPYMNMSVSTLRGVIKRLEDDKRISKRTDRQKTIFSICNWSKYQGDKRGKAANDLANDTSNDLANDSANVTEGQKNIKNIKKEKNLDTIVSKSKALQPVKKLISQEIDEAFSEWERVMGYAITANLKMNRYAATNLIKKHTLPVVKQHIMAAEMANRDMYAGIKIFDFRSLQSEADALKSWAKNSGKKVNTSKAKQGAVIS